MNYSIHSSVKCLLYTSIHMHTYIHTYIHTYVKVQWHSGNTVEMIERWYNVCSTHEIFLCQIINLLQYSQHAARYVHTVTDDHLYLWYFNGRRP